MFPAAIREAEIVVNFGQILLGEGGLKWPIKCQIV